MIEGIEAHFTVAKTEVDIFIIKVIKAAKSKNHKEIKALIASGPNINVLDNRKLSAVMHLIVEGDFAACAFLEQYGINIEDCLCGAAITGNLETYYYYRSKLEENGLTQNYNRIAAYAAYGGHTESVLSFLRSPHNPTPEYSRAISFAALNNKYDAVISLISHQLSTYRTNIINVAPYFALGGHYACILGLASYPINYSELRHFAAIGGHQNILFKFLISPSTAECNTLSVAAAQGGHVELTLKLLTHPNNRLPDYNNAAAYAAWNGHLDLAMTLLNHPLNLNPDFNKVASYAASANHQQHVKRLLSDPKNIHPDFNLAAVHAAGEGFTQLTFMLLTDPRNIHPDYNRAASSAAHGRQKALALALLTDSKNLSPDYEQVIMGALQSGQKAIADSVLELGMMSVMSSSMGPPITFARNCPSLEINENGIETEPYLSTKRQRR